MASVLINGTKIPYAYEKLTAITASTGLTAANIKQSVSTLAPYDKTRYADEVLITIEAGSIRATFDGTTPTVTASGGVGHIFNDGDSFTIQGYEGISKFRCINAVAANGAEVRVTYWRI
jgi:hypothetical protein